MKKALRISAWVLVFLLLLLLGAVVAIQSPAVQTALARKAAAKLADRIDGEVQVGHIAVRPFDAVVLEDVVITDRNPYSGGTLPRKDTLLRIGGLSARFSLKGLLHKERISVSRLTLDDAVFNLVIEPDSLGKSTTNLQRILRLSGGDSGPVRFGDLLDADRIRIRNFTFRMANPRNHSKSSSPLPSNVIDWNDLEINADITAKDLLVKDNFVIGEVEHLRLRDKTGLDLKEVSGKVKVGEGQVLLDNLHLRDGDSDLHLRYLRLLGTLGEDYSDFLERVRLEGQIAPTSVLSMKTVSHFAPNLEQFTFVSDISGKVEGTVSSFALKDVVFQEHASGVRGQVNGTMQGLPDITSTRMDFKVKDFQFGLGGLETFIREWAPDVRLNLDRFARGIDFRVDATARGTLDRLSVQGDVRSNAGDAGVDLVLGNLLDRTKDISIGGSLRTRDLNAGRLAGIEALGPVSMETELNATLTPGDPRVSIQSLKVHRLQALGYDYSALEGNGDYSKQAIVGRLVSHDPNLDFISEGRVSFSPVTGNSEYEIFLQLGVADLNALHLDKRGTSKVEMVLHADFLQPPGKDILGKVNIENIVLENDNGRYSIGDIQASAHTNDNIYRITFDSGFAKGSFVGDKSPIVLVQDLKDLLLRKELPALLDKPGKPWSGNSYAVDFHFYDTMDLLEFLYPDLYIHENTELRLTVDRNGQVDGNLESERLALDKNSLQDFQLNINNHDDVLRAGIIGSAIHLGDIDIQNNRLDLIADNNHFGLAYSFDNRTKTANKASIQFEGDFFRDRNGLSITANAHPSEIFYHGDQWKLDSDAITYRDGGLQVDRFSLTNGLQHLIVEGGISPSNTDTLSVQMERFDISMLNTILMGGKMGLKGKATGGAHLVSPAKPTPALLAGITCDSTYIAGRPMGSFRVESKWNEAKKHFDFLLTNQLEGKPSMRVEGFLRPGDKAIEVDADLHRFDLGYAAPVLDGIFHRFGGGLDGKVHVGGTLDHLTIGSEELQLVDGRLGIAFTQVVYNVSGPVSVDTEGLHFLDVSVSDDSEGKGKVSGSLLFGDFKNMAMDTHVRFDRMQVLGITDHASPIYGDVYGTGRVDITGPFNELALNVKARTVKDGDLHIPLSSGKVRSSSDLLVFKQPYVEVKEDPYLKKMKTSRSAKKQSQGDLDIRVNVQATPDVTAHIDIGENSLQGSGHGNIDVHLRPTQNVFTLGGDYTLEKGSFRFSALNVVTREFTIKEGSSIRFNDDVMNSDLDVTGSYSTRADISTLLSSSFVESDSRKDVSCEIHITDKLRNPKIEFDILFPGGLDPGTEGLVQSSLNTEDKRIKQFLYLLIANSFLPNEESGIITTGSPNMLYSNMTGIMAGQLNSIFQKLDIPLDLGLNYQQSASGTSLFDVALSTQLFMGRVVVNGTIGNRRLYGTTTEEVTGDLDIDIKLDKPGTFRLNLFSHSADQYTSFLDNSQRNGVGFAYQREFNTFRQFFNDLFSRRPESDDPTGREAPQPIPLQVLQIDSTGHAHPITPAHE